MAGNDRIRLFLALRLPEPALDACERWQASLSGGRAVGRDQLHVTLAFLGVRLRSELEPVVAELRAAAAAAGPILFEPLRYRETRTAGMLVLRDADGRAGELAGDLHERLAGLGVYRPETRRWLPHVTVLRFRTPPRLAPGLPELGPFAPSDAAAYLSRLSPSGAQYEVLEAVPLASS